VEKLQENVKIRLNKSPFFVIAFNFKGQSSPDPLPGAFLLNFIRGDAPHPIKARAAHLP